VRAPLLLLRLRCSRDRFRCAPEVQAPLFSLSATRGPPKVGKTATKAPRNWRGVEGLATKLNTCFKSLLARPAAPTRAKTRTRHAATSAAEEVEDDALQAEVGQEEEEAQALAADAVALPAVVAAEAAGGVEMKSLPPCGLCARPAGESLLAP